MSCSDPFPTDAVDELSCTHAAFFRMTPFTSRGTATTLHTPLPQLTSPAKRLRASAPFPAPPARRRLRTSRFLLRSTAGCALLRCVVAEVRCGWAAPSGCGRSRPRLPFSPSRQLGSSRAAAGASSALASLRGEGVRCGAGTALCGGSVRCAPLAAVLRSGGGAGLRRSGAPRLRAAAPGLQDRRSFCCRVKVF